MYNDAYYNIDNQKIIKAVLSTYRGRLDEDTLIDCGLNALWRCLQSHKTEFTTKFTTSLWRFVNWECKKELQNLARARHKPSELVDISIDSSEYTVFDDIDTCLDDVHSQIVKLRFLEGMTLKEIGNHFGFTKEAARQKLKFALKQIKELVYNSIEG